MRSLTEQDTIDGIQDDFLAALFLADEQTKAEDVRVSDRLETNLKQRFLAQPSSQKIIAALHQGDRLRDAAAIASVSVEVARKITLLYIQFVNVQQGYLTREKPNKVDKIVN